MSKTDHIQFYLCFTQHPSFLKSGLDNINLNWLLCCCCLVLTGRHAHFLADFSFTLALDEMGTRIDDLEKNVVELMTQAGMEEQATSK